MSREKRPLTVMTCDLAGCLRQPRRAPRILVPCSYAPWHPAHGPLRIMTTLHYCDPHRGGFCLPDYWTDDIKRRAERVAREKRPLEFKPDFDAARVEFVLVTTPEYRAFLRDMGMAVVAA